MSVKIEYNCDICRTEKPKQEILAVYFSSMKDFKLLKPGAIGFDDHKGVHICKSCLDRFKTA